MGIINFADQFNLNNDYGVQPANRTHIFNIAYSVELGNFTHNKIGGRAHQRLATLRHYAGAERRQPDRLQ